MEWKLEQNVICGEKKNVAICVYMRVKNTLLSFIKQAQHVEKTKIRANVFQSLVH